MVAGKGQAGWGWQAGTGSAGCRAAGPVWVAAVAETG